MEEIIKHIKELQPQERNILLLRLMRDKVISFFDFSNAYVKVLEIENDDNRNKLIEAETCVLEGIIADESPAKDNVRRKSQLRSLYLLNQSKRFNMEDTNKKLEYDEETARNYSWYERQKKTIEAPEKMYK